MAYTHEDALRRMQRFGGETLHPVDVPQWVAKAYSMKRSRDETWLNKVEYFNGKTYRYAVVRVYFEGAAYPEKSISVGVGGKWGRYALCN